MQASSHFRLFWETNHGTTATRLVAGQRVRKHNIVLQANVFAAGVTSEKPVERRLRLSPPRRCATIFGAKLNHTRMN